VAFTHLGQKETLAGERKQIDCVEIYLPKSIEFLSELYHLLREKVANHLGFTKLEGFSIYETDGVFQGEKLWEQRTLVIRVLFIRPNSTSEWVTRLVSRLGQEIATTVAVNEEEIWICHYPLTLTIFRGAKRLLK
jgi:hypothetical protein